MYSKTGFPLGLTTTKNRRVIVDPNAIIRIIEDGSQVEGYPTLIYFWQSSAEDNLVVKESLDQIKTLLGL